MATQTILVVEDDPQLRVLISRALKEHGYDVRSAATGAEMQVQLEDGRPALIVLDIMLPGTNGIELLRRLRTTSDIPVIFASARGEEADRVVGLELGADDYLAKPFGTRELLARISAVLRLLLGKTVFSKLKTRPISSFIGKVLLTASGGGFSSHKCG